MSGWMGHWASSDSAWQLQRPGLVIIKGLGWKGHQRYLSPNLPPGSKVAGMRHPSRTFPNQVFHNSVTHQVHVEADSVFR